VSVRVKKSVVVSMEEVSRLMMLAAGSLTGVSSDGAAVTMVMSLDVVSELLLYDGKSSAGGAVFIATSLGAVSVLSLADGASKVGMVFPPPRSLLETPNQKTHPLS